MLTFFRFSPSLNPWPKKGASVTTGFVKYALFNITYVHHMSGYCVLNAICIPLRGSFPIIRLPHISISWSVAL